MTRVAITESYLGDIADAIRSKNGSLDTYTPAEMATAISNIPTGGIINNQNKTVNPSTSQQSVTYDSGYTGLGTVTVNAMPSGSATGPSSISSTGATVSTSGSNTLTLSKSGVSTTPTVSAGYVGSATSSTANVSLSASVNIRSSSSLSANNLTVTAPAGYYGSDATKTLTDSNLTAGNIKNGVPIFGVTGTYTGSGGGGSSMNVQVVQQGNTRVGNTNYAKACGDLTVSTAGTYDVYWTCYRTSTSGTWATRLYKGSSGLSAEQTTFSSYYQTVHLTNVTLAKNDVLSVYAKTRGTNYYAYVGQLTIVQTA